MRTSKITNSIVIFLFKFSDDKTANDKNFSLKNFILEEKNKDMSEIEIKEFINDKRKVLAGRAFKFFEDKILSIEIVREDNCLERIFFFKLPFFDALTKDIKTKFNKNVTRMSCKTKCNEMVQGHEDIIEEIKRESQIIRFKLIKFISKHMKLLQKLTYFIVLIINMIILFSFKKDASNMDNTVDNFANTVMIPIFGIAVIVFAIAIVGYNIYQRIPVIMKAWEGFDKTNVNIFKFLDRVLGMIINILKVINFLKNDFEIFSLF